MTMTTELPLALSEAISNCIQILKLHGDVVDSGHWQGVSTTGHPEMLTQEVINLHFTAQIPERSAQLVHEVAPNMPWAEDEFQERVAGEAHNPHWGLEKWPWWREQTEATMYHGMFTHTYSERFWPNTAHEDAPAPITGIRYKYGDLNDVLTLLFKHPYTRQATLPIFYPEDTGGVHGGRIPCTLQYHFLMRQHKMHMFYAIRSCDAVRHFRDDIYIACRLVQWTLDQLRMNAYEFGNPSDQAFWEDVKPGALCFHAYSFHVHKADWHLL